MKLILRYCEAIHLRYTILVRSYNLETKLLFLCLRTEVKLLNSKLLTLFGLEYLHIYKSRIYFSYVRIQPLSTTAKFSGTLLGYV